MRCLGLHPFLEERVHVRRQILDHRQVAERRNPDHAVVEDAFDMGAAGPARLVIDHHGAGPAHANAARKAVGQRRVGLLLDPGDDVEDGLAWLFRHGKAFIGAAVGIATPDGHRDGVVRVLPICRVVIEH